MPDSPVFGPSDGDKLRMAQERLDQLEKRLIQRDQEIKHLRETINAFGKLADTIWKEAQVCNLPANILEALCKAEEPEHSE